jgi:predicted alpha-1,2-mannosidase
MFLMHAFALFLFAACGGGEKAADGGLDGGAADGSAVPDASIDAGTGKLVAFVDPFLGTGGVGFGVGQMVPGALVPFGMVKVGPDTESTGGTPGFSHCAGYYYNDDMVQGFSHVRVPGIGVPDLGNLLFMPVTGMDQGKTVVAGYRSYFSHKDEKATPGYYSVLLQDTGIKAELTAARRAAAHRYTWPAGADRFVVIDLAHALPGNGVKNEHVLIDQASGAVKGSLNPVGGMAGRYGGPIIYFHAKFNRPVTSYGTWSDKQYQPGSAKADGDRIGAFLGFGVSDGSPLEVIVGISYVSQENAELNLNTDMPGFDFDGYWLAAEEAWEKELSVAKVEGGTTSERKQFYTALYHIMYAPTMFTDPDGRYVGMDQKAHTAADFTYYTDFSMWDTYRTLHSLMALLKPGRQTDMVKSLIRMYEDGGAFPIWPIASGEGGSMVGESADIIIADSYMRGLTGFDAEKALQGMLLTADGPSPAKYGGRGGLSDYLNLGYVTADKNGGSVSVTQEYCYDDFAIAQLAGALGKSDVRDRFIGRSKKYANLWNGGVKFFAGRNSDGSWVPGFKDTTWEDYYVEGDAWQYRFFVPYDIPGLASLFGGNAELLAALDDLFAKSKAEQPSRADKIIFSKYYWQGNEPDIHTAYMYSELGRPDLTAEWVRWIMKTEYGPGPDGLPGNDDCGTMSAWLAFSMLGFYPVPAKDTYLVGSPVFPRVELDLAGGKFVVEAAGASKENKYVRSAELNGKPLDKPWFKHADIASGGSLKFVMGPSPSDWGRH